MEDQRDSSTQSAAAGRYATADPGKVSCLGPVLGFACRCPFLALILIVIVSNLVGSYFNITYNKHLIVEHYLTPPQVEAFWGILVPAYNAVAYSVGFVLVLVLFGPVIRCRRRLLRGAEVTPEMLRFCQRRVINLPVYTVLLNAIFWLPGAIIFPLGILAIGGWDGAPYIWLQFAISFSMSALLTSMQTFFLVEEYLVSALYKDFFGETRPADVPGVLRLPLGWRVFLLWCSIAVAPLVALVVVALNFTEDRREQFEDLRWLAAGVAIVGLPTSGFLMWMVGRNILKWVRAHASATEAISQGVFSVRIDERRPDEWGQLTDRFNDMAGALEKAEYVRETFGQFVSADVRETILSSYRGLGGSVREITVLFADIRGFTRRSCGESPEETVALLNRFLSLAVSTIEGRGGWVNKFLGDGVMALFGAPRMHRDHAQRAVDAATELQARLRSLNVTLETEGRCPISVGVGIHTGPALVGCIGAETVGPDGKPRIRREFTAIGETVNLAQRLEQLTKVHGVPVILSDETVSRLHEPPALRRIGPVEPQGATHPIVIHACGVAIGGVPAVADDRGASRTIAGADATDAAMGAGAAVLP